MAAMEQFSHDLTLALEESSRTGANLHNRWGLHRRTRSTGNLQDSSSSPLECFRPQGVAGLDGQQITQSDSDESHAQRLNLNSQKLLGLHVGNFESDSFNENFSPLVGNPGIAGNVALSAPSVVGRISSRRKRKFKRSAIEYETTTTPSTPNLSCSINFPVSGNMLKKKRSYKHSARGGGQENFRANLFFCGKRKRCHRERSMDCEMRDPKGHRFSSQWSYLEYKTCKKHDRHASGLRLHEKILPLNKTIVSKIEKISKESKNFPDGFIRKGNNPMQKVVKLMETDLNITQQQHPIQPTAPITAKPSILKSQTVNKNAFQKSASLDSCGTLARFAACGKWQNQMQKNVAGPPHRPDRRSEYLYRKHAFRNPYAPAMPGGHHHMDDDEGVMDCSNAPGGFVSSSSLSSSDSEAVLTNESDREGDDELTDFPGNETMASIQQHHQLRVNSAHDKQHRMKFLMNQNQPPQPQIAQIASPVQIPSPVYITSPVRAALVAACPMDDDVMWGTGAGSCSGGDGSLGDVSSDPVSGLDVREIRAGCRRIRDERPGFSVLTSANELLSRFLQDSHQTELRLGALDSGEIEKLGSLAVMYSLDMKSTPDQTVLTKTSNTMQAVKVEQTNMSRRLLTDFKRRCYSVPGHKINQPDSDNN